MDKQLESKLPLSAKNIWRIYSFIQIAFLSIVYILLIYIFDNEVIPLYIKIIVALVLVAYTFVIILIVPKVRWDILSYEVRNHEIEIQKGLFIVKRTIIPIIRVHQVDVKHGPPTKKKS